jgi:hypothetical protein
VPAGSVIEHDASRGTIISEAVINGRSGKMSRSFGGDLFTGVKRKLGSRSNRQGRSGRVAAKPTAGLAA